MLVNLKKIMGFKLLLKMLGIITLVIVVLVIASLFIGENLSYLAYLVPLGLFAFIVYKFGKEGLVSILIFLGGVLILGSVLLGFLGQISDLTLYITLIIGVILIVIAFLLGKMWGVKIFKKRRIVSSESF